MSDTTNIVGEEYALVKKEKKTIVAVGKPFWVGIAILVLLMILSLIVLSVKLYDYTQVDRYAVSLKSNMKENLDLFSMTYENASGEITVEGADGAKVIAPGTDVEYTVRLRNTDKVAINYAFIPAVESSSAYQLPLEVRLLDPDDNYLLGDAKTWVPVSTLSGLEASGTLLKGETAEYIFQWRWPFESGDDAYDTFLGDTSFEQSVGVSIAFSIYAEANLELEANGGLWGTSLGTTLLFILIALLLLIAIILLIISIFKRIEQTYGMPFVHLLFDRDSDPEPMPEPEYEPEPEPVIDAEPIPEPEPEPEPVVTIVRKEAFNGKMAYINLDTLYEHFEDGDRITLAILKKRGLLGHKVKQMKILARLDKEFDKTFIIETQGISVQARKLVIAAGGEVIITRG